MNVHLQDVEWTSYVPSIYVLCLRGRRKRSACLSDLIANNSVQYQLFFKNSIHGKIENDIKRVEYLQNLNLPNLMTVICRNFYCLSFCKTCYWYLKKQLYQNVYKTFRRCPGRLLNVSCTFSYVLCLRGH